MKAWWISGITLLLTISAPGEQAVVVAPATVYSGMSGSAEARGSLATDERVTIEMRMSSGSNQWCSIRRAGDAPLTGFVDCSKLRAAAIEARFSPVLSSDKSLDDLLRVSGYEHVIGQFTDPSLLRQALTRDGRKPEAAQKIMDVFMQTFHAERFLAPIRTALQKEYTEPMAAGVMSWYNSDVGRQIVQIEASSVTSASRAEFQEFLKGLRSNPPPPSRAALVERLWRVADFSELQIEMATSVTRTLGEALNPRLPREKRLTEQKLQQITAVINKMRPIMADLGKARFLYLYRDLSDVQLEEYVRFSESPAGQWFRRGLYTGGAEGVRAFLIDFAKAMME